MFAPPPTAPSDRVGSECRSIILPAFTDRIITWELFREQHVLSKVHGSGLSSGLDHFVFGWMSALKLHDQLVNPIQRRHQVVMRQAEADAHEAIHAEVVAWNDEHALLRPQPLRELR